MAVTLIDIIEINKLDASEEITFVDIQSKFVKVELMGVGVERVIV